MKQTYVHIHASRLNVERPSSVMLANDKHGSTYHSHQISLIVPLTKCVNGPLVPQSALTGHVTSLRGMAQNTQMHRCTQMHLRKHETNALHSYRHKHRFLESSTHCCRPSLQAPEPDASTTGRQGKFQSHIPKQTPGTITMTAKVEPPPQSPNRSAAAQPFRASDRRHCPFSRPK